MLYAQTWTFRFAHLWIGGIEIICRLLPTHQPTLHLRFRHGINPRSTPSSWARPASLYDRLENNIWIHGVWGERLAGCPMHFSQTSCMVVCFLYPSDQMLFLRRLAGVRHISPVVLWTLFLGWVGASNEHAPFKVHDVSHWFCRLKSDEI